MNDEFNMSKEIERGFIALKFNTTVFEFSNRLEKLEGELKEISIENLKSLISLFEQNIKVIDDILEEGKKCYKNL